MISTSILSWESEAWRSARPGAAALLTVASWLVFIWTEPNPLLLVVFNLLVVGGIWATAALRHRLLLTLLSTLLLVHLSFFALYTWPVPNLLILLFLLGSLTTVWHTTMGHSVSAFDRGMLLAATTMAWAATAYFPTTLINATTLTALPLFVLLPPVYHRLYRPAWLFVSFSLCLVAAAAIIQTTVLFSS